MNLIREEKAEELRPFEEIDYDAQKIDTISDWFDANNNDNVEGDQAMLDDWLDDDNDQDTMLGVVEPDINEDDRFLGRIPNAKPKMRIFGNDKGVAEKQLQIRNAPVKSEFVDFVNKDQCVKNHQNIKGTFSLNLLSIEVVASPPDKSTLKGLIRTIL